MRNSLKNQAAAKWRVASGRVILALAILTGGAGLAQAAANPPVVTAKALTKDTTPVWTWTAGGGGSGAYRYKLDDPNLKSGATITTMLNFTPKNSLAEGEHTLYVQERDKAGNWSAAGSRAIQIDPLPLSVAGTIPDTGQTKCYNNAAAIPCPTPGLAYYGQDANYAINPPSYTVHDNGTVTDNVTGLMWQREDDNVTRPWATPSPTAGTSSWPVTLTGGCLPTRS